MKKMKKEVLKNVAKVSRIAAWGGGGFPSWLGMYEPKTPEILKEMKKTK